MQFCDFYLVFYVVLGVQSCIFNSFTVSDVLPFDTIDQSDEET